MKKRLYRYPDEGIVFGLGAGIGKYFDIDPVFVRLAIVVLAVLTDVWVALIAYLVLFFVVPVDPAQQKVDREQSPRDVTPEPAEPIEHMDGSQNM